ncbi:hypothetical protein EDC94DRAFT_604226 [Helicostylum pulchrum]|nr:hypothetical protein EDC94DRAFT_604226 [Helicostylum pulchrum]
MSNIPRDWRLPFEILEQIFRNIPEKEYLKICLTVCKAWKLVAQQYFDPEISLKLEQDELKALSEDIQHFGQNVTVIKLINHKYVSIDDDDKHNWIHILALSPNIASIYFLNHDNIAPFLEILLDPFINLNNLQIIATRELVACPIDVQDIYLRANIRCRENITSLQVSTLTTCRTFIEYGGIVEYVSQFPRLTCLKVNSLSIPEVYEYDRQCLCIDVKHLLKESPQLKELKLYNCSKITSNWQDPNLVETIVENVSLTSLKLTVDEISTVTLKYIVALLKEVKVLQLRIGLITQDETISENETTAILDDLSAYTSAMKKVQIDYTYNGNEFLLEFDLISKNYEHRAGMFGDDDDNDFDYDQDSDEFSDEYGDEYGEEYDSEVYAQEDMMEFFNDLGNDTYYDGYIEEYSDEYSDNYSDDYNDEYRM